MICQRSSKVVKYEVYKIEFKIYSYKVEHFKQTRAVFFGYFFKVYFSKFECFLVVAYEFDSSNKDNHRLKFHHRLAEYLF